MSQMFTVTVLTITSLGKMEKRVMSDVTSEHLELILRTEGIGLEEDTYLNIEFLPQSISPVNGARMVPTTTRRRR